MNVIEDTEGQTHAYCRLRGVQLTEEILVANGFKLDGVHYRKSVGRKHILLFPVGAKFWLTLGMFTVKLQYAHQLQNICFSLTDENMKIKHIEDATV
jgi:hypothetical protein